MKKIVIVIAIFFAGLNSSQAQISVGGIVGANYSNVVGPNGVLDESKYTVNYFLGVCTSIPLTERINFLGDAVYALKGYSIDFGLTTSEFKFRANYLDLMPKIELRVADFLGIAVGANLGVNVGEATKSGTGVWQKSAPGQRNLNSNFALIGALRGYFGNVFVEASYSHGLNNISGLIFTDINGNPIGVGRTYLRNFNLGVGYLFEL